MQRLCVTQLICDWQATDLDCDGNSVDSAESEFEHYSKPIETVNLVNESSAYMRTARFDQISGIIANVELDEGAVTRVREKDLELTLV